MCVCPVPRTQPIRALFRSWGWEGKDCSGHNFQFIQSETRKSLTGPVMLGALGLDAGAQRCWEEGCLEEAAATLLGFC